ncbi:MAG: glutamate--tRNA ligase [Porticoccaceae bacterium]|nr:MAG: glutamate--tRNA ligase [Porticoccaceae bacterium]
MVRNRGDEGPDISGSKGPYRQSERSSIYKEKAQILVDEGKAFKCFCTAKRLDELRETQARNKIALGYDGKCLSLSENEVADLEKNQTPFVIRMKTPDNGLCEFEDMLRGKISIDWNQVDMQVLLKADGMPTYHLANVVDDHLMEITHIIRGEEWINSAPKHILLYEYFGWKVPKFCHLPLLRNTDKSKLSKRKNPTSILYYREKGFLPEALLNYLGRMGWSMPDEREKFTLAEMLDVFDIQRISLGGPVFDVEKLEWLNGVWIRDELSDDDLKSRLETMLPNHNNLDQLLPLVKPRMRLLSDYEKITEFLFTEVLNITEDNFFSLNTEKELIIKILQFTSWSLDSIDDWTRDVIFITLKNVAEFMNIKLKNFLAPIFVAVAGTTSSISVMDSICILGKSLSIGRIHSSIELLGGIKEQKYDEFLLEFNRSRS